MNLVGSADFRIQPARRSDIPRLAELLVLGTGGLMEAVYDDIPGAPPAGLLIERRFARAGSVGHYRNSVVAITEGEVVGLLHSYPLDEAMDEASDPVIPPERLAYWMPFRGLSMPGSYYISALAVLPEYRNRGIGRALLDHARERARELSLERISLHVFEENRYAVDLYLRNGFTIEGRVPVVPHELIRYRGDFLLMAASVGGKTGAG